MAVILEQVLECGADGAFVFLTELCISFELGIVVFDGFVGRFDVEIWHDELSVFSTQFSVECNNNVNLKINL